MKKSTRRVDFFSGAGDSFAQHSESRSDRGPTRLVSGPSMPPTEVEHFPASQLAPGVPAETVHRRSARDTGDLGLRVRATRSAAASAGTVPQRQLRLTRTSYGSNRTATRRCERRETRLECHRLEKLVCDGCVLEHEPAWYESERLLLCARTRSSDVAY